MHKIYLKNVYNFTSHKLTGRQFVPFSLKAFVAEVAFAVGIIMFVVVAAHTVFSNPLEVHSWKLFDELGPSTVVDDRDFESFIVRVQYHVSGKGRNQRLFLHFSLFERIYFRSRFPRRAAKQSPKTKIAVYNDYLAFIWYNKLSLLLAVETRR